MTTYRLRHISDLLRIPIDRLGACLAEVEHGVELARFALGVDLPDDLEVVIPYMDWTDDDLTIATVRASDGSRLTLEVIDEDEE